MRPTRYQRRWQPAEENTLITLLEDNWSYERIAERLNRSPKGVASHAKQHLGMSITNNGAWSASHVGKLLGVRCSAVEQWIILGYLQAARLPIRRVRWAVAEADVIVFLENPDYWHLWEVTWIKDIAWREWARELRKEVEFITLNEAARLLGFAHGGCIWTLMKQGYFNGHRRGVRGSWLLRREEVLAFPQIERPAKCARVWTAEEDEFLRCRRQEGWSYRRIAKALGCGSTGTRRRYLAMQHKTGGGYAGNVDVAGRGKVVGDAPEHNTSHDQKEGLDGLSDQRSGRPAVSAGRC